VRPRQPDRSRRHIGAVLGELHHLGTVYDVENAFGSFYLDARRPGKVGSEVHLPISRFHDRLACVPESDSPQTHSVFDEFVTVDVPNVRPVSAGDEPGRILRILVVSLGVCMGTSRNEAVGSALETLGFAKIWGDVIGQ
jgi:hypothetical protein